MGHSSTTHAIAYSSQQVGSEEAHFNAYHCAIGDVLSNIPIHHHAFPWQTYALQCDFGIQLLSPNNGHEHYLSLQQKELVEFGYGTELNNKPQHCLALLAPGEGKSESYIIPTIARHLATKPKTIIHVSPYRFLAGYQFAMASTAFEKLSSSQTSVFFGAGHHL
ncbi:hypothetical protein MHU86_22672 [Fragilaria crotonensis]|nr:hypothetical protein MHU86_22672 [Fragilaria crotonensis]